MKESDSQTQGHFERSDLERFVGSDKQMDQVKLVAIQLQGEGFRVLVEYLKYSLKEQWEKAVSVENRERLHSELLGLKSMQKKVNALTREFKK